MLEIRPILDKDVGDPSNFRCNVTLPRRGGSRASPTPDPSPPLVEDVNRHRWVVVFGQGPRGGGTGDAAPYDRYCFVPGGGGGRHDLWVFHVGIVKSCCWLLGGGEKAFFDSDPPKLNGYRSGRAERCPQAP